MVGREKESGMIVLTREGFEGSSGVCWKTINARSRKRMSALGIISVRTSFILDAWTATSLGKCDVGAANGDRCDSRFRAAR